MKSKLYSIGCSHSTRIYNYNKTKSAKPYNEWIAEWLEFELINLSQPAAGNDFILNTFIQLIDKLNKNDLVIIQLTHFVRKNFYCDKNKEKSFGLYHKIGEASDIKHPINLAWYQISEYIFPQTIIDMFELVSKIEKLIDCKIYIFSYEDWNRYDTYFYKNYFDSKQLIKFGNERFNSLGKYCLNYKLKSLSETGEFEDGHMSSESHKSVASLIYSYIKENE